MKKCYISSEIFTVEIKVRKSTAAVNPQERERILLLFKIFRDFVTIGNLPKHSLLAKLQKK